MGGNATRDRVTWTKWRGTGEVRLVHGLRDKEPQEIPIPPYSPARKVVVALENRASSKRRARVIEERSNLSLIEFGTLPYIFPKRTDFIMVLN